MARRINLTHINVARADTIRNINRQIILNYVREEGPVSRAHIARITELQRSTVSLIVDELLEAQLIQETEGESSGGRPPQLLTLNTSYPVAIGIDLGQKVTVIGTSDLSGRLLDKLEFPTSADFRETMDRIIKDTQYFIKRSEGSIEGIGLSLAGLVESGTSKVFNIPHFNWRNPTIVETIEDATGLQVIAENDTNAIALAELWLGQPEIRNIRNFVVVLIRSGIGTGIVFDGQIYRGKGGVAGEFGHMTIGSNAPIACAAGSYDCWEAFASERAALARYSTLSGRNGSKITFPQLIQLALKGDFHSQKALKETAHYIGVGIANLVKGLSPDVTIVAGNLVQVWSLIAEDLQKGAEGAMCQGYPAINVIPSTLGAYPSLMGAICLTLANKFTSFHVN